MASDEQQIRQLVATWMAASQAGDIPQLLSLMTEDVVFLVPGQSVMHKADFAAATSSEAGRGTLSLQGQSEIQEIQVLGDWAFMWPQLTVVATPADGSPAIKHAGHTLSILKKERGKWRLARDANLLAPVPTPEA